MANERRVGNPDWHRADALMARMIPVDGPIQLDTPPGEHSVFYLLKYQLPDDFVVIHSLPWLSAAVRSVDPNYAPTGEIDFLILHPNQGLLALEVKSGRYTIHGAAFARVTCGTDVDVLRQTRHNVHGLARWLGGTGVNVKIGYGLVFPHSVFPDAALGPGLVDRSMGSPRRIVIDQSALPKMREQVIDLMAYWRQALRVGALGDLRLNQILDALCPAFDGSPMWAARAATDREFWLRLTPEQASALQHLGRNQRNVVTGWPGTGKTLLAIELARVLSRQNKRVLVVTFNARLADRLREQLASLGPNCLATHWHKYCADARRVLKRCPVTDTRDWFDHECLSDLSAALAKSALPRFDALVVDEAQAFRPAWLELLIKSVGSGPATAFCDETQRFCFEREGAGLAEIQTIVGASDSYLLTQVARMPRAITNRLIDIAKPSYQVSSSRAPAEDTLQERILDPSPTELESCIDKLTKEGMSERDIVVLTSSVSKLAMTARLAGRSIDVETAARFRGMESPAVVIADAHLLTDEELFCAYSRATTVCIALFDCEGLAWRPAGLFQNALTESPKTRERLTKARHHSAAASIVRAESAARFEPLRTVALGWSAKWGAWVLELEDTDDPRRYWRGFLTSQHSAPVYFWYAKSRREFFAYFEQLDDPYPGGTCIGPLLAQSCARCKMVMPHTRTKFECLACAGELRPRVPRPSPELLNRLVQIDAALSSLGSETPDWSSIRALPLALFVLAISAHARSNARHKALGLPPLPTGTTLLYRAAAACVQADLVRAPPGETFVVNKLADRIRPQVPLPDDTSDREWRIAIASAFGALSIKRIVKKVSKGI